MPLLLVLVAACGGDQKCTTCPPGPEPKSVPFPDLAGVWSIGLTTSFSSEFGAQVSSTDLVAEVRQDAGRLTGWIGGNSSSCVLRPVYSCSEKVIPATAMQGTVSRDGTVTLSWSDAGSALSLQGTVEGSGLSGPVGTTGLWAARRQTPVPVAQARLRTGDTVVVRGVVTVSRGLFSGGDVYPGNVVYVQDGSAGIELVGLPKDLSLLQGDSVLVRARPEDDGYGERALVSLERDLGGLDRPPTVVRLGSGTVPAPRVVTVAGVKANSYEGSLVTLRGVRLPGKPSPAGTAYFLVFADGGGATFEAVVHPAVASTLTLASWVVGATYDVTGIAGSSEGTPNLQLRGPGDRLKR